MSRPAIAWERIGASGLMFLNAPGVKWAGGEASPVKTDGGAGRDMANDPSRPPFIPGEALSDRWIRLHLTQAPTP